MKILYGIQGTGHGHISRAREIVPLLSEQAEVEVLISGYNYNMNLGDLPVIQKRGISLAYDEKGSVSYLKTAFRLKPVTFIRDIHSIELNKYDLIISDFEPVTAWAAHQTNRFSVGLSHQASFWSSNSPRPLKKSIIGEQILKYFAPCTNPVGFHFQRYDSFILPPVIRRDVRMMSAERGKHVTVYLPAFHHRLLVKTFNRIPGTDWHIFSPECKESYTQKNVIVHPVGDHTFLESMKSCFGVITGAGFETCAEAMFLGKKLLAIPISNQYEQYCNASALHQMGIQTLRTIDNSFVSTVKDWILYAEPVQLREITDTAKLADLLIHLAKNQQGNIAPDELPVANHGDDCSSFQKITR